MKTENERQTNEKEEKKDGYTSSLNGVVCTCPGSKLAPVYKRVYNEKLDREIVDKVDEVNIFEFIQASKSTTDLATLQKRFLELGEIPAVDPNMQFGVDNAVLPSDIHSLYNMVNDVDNNFKKLPESVQNVFGSAQAYLAAILDGSVNAKISAHFNQPNDVQTETKGENV